MHDLRHAAEWPMRYTLGLESGYAPVAKRQNNLFDNNASGFISRMLVRHILRYCDKDR